MKIVTEKNGKMITYIQKKDMVFAERCYRPDYDYSEEFIQLTDYQQNWNLVTEWGVMDYNRLSKLSIKELRRRMENIHLDDLHPIRREQVANCLKDLQNYYEFKMGRKNLNLPIIEIDGVKIEASQNGVDYELSQLIDPFCILLKKTSGEKFSDADEYPIDAINQMFGVVAECLGLEGFMTYDLDISFTEDKRAAVLRFTSPEYLEYMAKEEKKCDRKLNSTHHKLGKALKRIGKKLDVWS